MVSAFNVRTLCTIVLSTVVLVSPVLASASDDGDSRELRGMFGRRHESAPHKTLAASWDGGVIEAGRRRGHLDIVVDDLVDGEGFEIQYDPEEKPLIFETLERVDNDDDPFSSYTGFDADTGSEIIFTVFKASNGVETLTGTLYVESGATYQFRKIGEDEIIIDRVDEFAPEQDEDEEEEYEEDEEETDAEGRALVQVPIPRKLGEKANLDVMVVTTNEAMCEAASQHAGCSAAEHSHIIESIIFQAVAETNQAYETSGVNARIRLAHIEHDNTYLEKNDFRPMLTELRRATDGPLDYIHSLRNQKGADFVVMMSRSIGWNCGLGIMGNMKAGSAFSIVAWNCATGNLSFAHEIGHNQGLHHDRIASGAARGVVDGYIYYGFQDRLSRFRTIMSTDCKNKSCPRRPRFSGRKSKWVHDGQNLPTGNKAHDAVTWLNDNMDTFAAYKPERIGGTGLTAVPTVTPVGAGTPGIFTDKDTYEVGEDIEITFTYGDKKVSATDLVGIFERDTLSHENLRQYAFTCGDHLTACDHGFMRASIGFFQYRGPVWPNLPVGTYVVALDGEATISNDLWVSKPFKIVPSMAAAGDIAACANNVDFTFETDGQLAKGCDYIDMDWKINDYCGDPGVTRNCPMACKFCENDEYICSDDENFEFMSSTGEPLRCRWIDFDWKREEYCTEDFEGGTVKEACKASCNVCTTM